MRKSIVLIMAILVIITCKGQGSGDFNCKILTNFLSDKKILELFNIDVLSRDTITIIDSCNSFENCKWVNLNNRAVFITKNEHSLNVNPGYRKDISSWKCHILIYKFESGKNYKKIYFFYKPTNATGFVRYKLKERAIISVDYSLGQL